MDKLVLIDGNSLVNRAFFATPHFTNKAGFPTNGIFGFIKLFLKIVRDLKPKYAVVAFDEHAPTFRHKKYAQYKGTRKPMPEDLVVQMPVLKECLALMNVKMCSMEGIEADDILGSLTRKFDSVESYVYTGDRDSYQLVKENVNVCYTLKGVSEILRLTEDNFYETVGLRPAQIIDLKALMGDASDNIPGVPGIGEKMAKNLLSEYESLEDVYAHLDALKPACRNKLEANKDLAYLSKDLATIDVNVPLNFGLEDCLLKTPFSAAVRQKFAALDFRMLYSDESLYEAENASEEAEREQKTVPVRKISSYSEVKEEIRCARSVALSWEEKKSFYIIGGSCEYEITMGEDLLSLGTTETEIGRILQAIFGEKEKLVILYRAKEAMYAAEKFGVKIEAEFEDVSILKYLVDFSDKDESLNFILESYGYSKECPAYSLALLYELLKEKNAASGMEELYREIEKPLCEVLYRAERVGAAVNESLLRSMGESYSARIGEISEEIYRLAGEKFNLNSSAQLGKILFEKMGVSGGKKSKSGAYSCGADVLEKLAPDYKIAAEVLKYRKIQKLNSTYIEGLKPFIRDGRVHTTYTQTVTSTGRLSSKNPNLQNIPIRTEEGREIRKLFVASEGNILLDADYSQIELRLMAHFSDCKGLIEAFNKGADIHRETAAKVYGISPEAVTGDMRRRAKAVNFGIIYGESAFGLSQSLGIGQSEAAEFIRKYFESYPEVKEYLDETVAFAKTNGYVTTLFGRKRSIPELKASNFMLRKFGERAAMNMPLQGTSADIIKLAMISTYRELRERRMRSELILQVHDELVLDAPLEEAEETKILLKECMENVVKLKVPLIAEVSEGKNWYDAK